MRMSELSTRAGVSVATVKFYLREGLLAPGESINAREASYSERHVERLRLIRGLVHVSWGIRGAGAGDPPYPR